jgi:hypothetical protein
MCGPHPPHPPLPRHRQRPIPVIDTYIRIYIGIFTYIIYMYVYIDMERERVRERQRKQTHTYGSIISIYHICVPCAVKSSWQLCSCPPHSWSRACVCARIPIYVIYTHYGIALSSLFGNFVVPRHIGGTCTCVCMHIYTHMSYVIYMYRAQSILLKP